MKILLSIALFSSSYLWAQNIGKIPNEFESMGGHSLGFANGGVAAISELNPAMRSLEKKYEIIAGYHWPSYGREFYQVGVVDSKTSDVAAAILLTSPWQDYESPKLLNNNLPKDSLYYDTPIIRRLSLAVAYSFSLLSMGLSGQYIESNIEGSNKKGVTFGFGVAGLLTPTLRFGASIENLNNSSVIKDVAPRTIRAGLAYLISGGTISIHADYRQRDRVPMETPSSIAFKKSTTDIHEALSSSEKMAIASFSIRTQNLLRIVGGYGRSIDKSKRESAALGIALVKSIFSLSYLVSKPYLSDDTYHHAINMSYNINV
jgi:hypothetical protein